MMEREFGRYFPDMWAIWDKGVLEIPQQEMFDLAGRIGRRM